MVDLPSTEADKHSSIVKEDPTDPPEDLDFLFTVETIY